MARELQTKKKSRKASHASAAASPHSSFASTKASFHSSFALAKVGDSNKGDGSCYKSSDAAKKSQCDLCKMSYTSEKELSIHLVSLMHHIKMEEKEKKPSHHCTLCRVMYATMDDYRKHIATSMHQKKIYALRQATDSGHLNIKRAKKLKKKKSCHTSSNSGAIQFNRLNECFQNTRSPSANLMPHLNNHLIRNNQQGFIFQFGNKGFSGSSKKSLQSNKFGIKRAKLRQAMHKGVGNHGRDRDCQWRQHYEPWGSGILGDYYKNQSRAGYWENDWRFNLAYQNDFSRQLWHPKFTEFASSDFSDDWDEQSLIQHEEFLAGINDMNFSTKYQEPGFSYNEREMDLRPRERKRPYFDDSEDYLFTKMSRFADFFVDGNPPVQQRTYAHKAQSNLSASRSMTTPHSQIPLHEGASSNILERAKNLCRELRAKRDASQEQPWGSRLHHDWFNNNIETQQPVCKSVNKELENLQCETHFPSDENSLSKNASQSISSHVCKSVNKESENPQCKPHFLSDKNSLSQNSSHSISPHDPVSKTVSADTTHVTPRLTDYGRTLDEIKKSIENGLESKEKPENKSISSTPVENRQRQCSIGDTEQSMTIISRDVASRCVLSKPSSKQQLTRDNIKKIINCPNSRNERLQFAKMLHSRNESKTSSYISQKSSLQHEGAQDILDAAPEINFESDQNGGIQTIKLEDLSDGVQHQIMELIGGDVCNLTAHQTETASVQNKLSENTSDAPENVIMLSDDDHNTCTSKQSKSNFQETCNVRTVEELNNAPEKKKRKRVTFSPPSVCESEVSAISSAEHQPVVSSAECYQVSKSQLENHREHLPSSVPVKKNAKKRKNIVKDAVDSRDKICTSSVESDKVPNSEVLDSLTNSNTGNSFSSTQLPTSTEQQNLSENEAESLSSDQSQINNSAGVDILPTVINNLGTEKTLPHASHTLTLPPSTWLKDRPSVPPTNESCQTSINNTTTVLSSTAIKTKVENTCNEVTVLSDNEEHSTVDNESSSEIMRELLVLSESEEKMKQEKTSLDLRLSRLHKLLEQAVVQINKCTERRDQLYKEEQELSKQRLSLLRDATLLNPIQRSVIQDQMEQRSGPDFTSSDHCQSLGTRYSNMKSPPNTYTLSSSTQEPAQSSTSEAALSASTIGENNQGTSLSKADWLAKFSSFLPDDSSKKENQMQARISFKLHSEHNLQSNSLVSS